MNNQSGDKELTLLQFTVQSTDPNITTSMLLEDMSKNEAELESMLSEQAKIESASLRRQGNLPIGLETAVITVVVNLATEAAREAGKETLKKLADDAYEWFKKRWKNAKFERAQSSGTSKREHPKRHS